MKKLLWAVVMILFFSSGCLQIGDDKSTEGVDTGEENSVVDLDYIECMLHEDMERCWNVFVPSTVNLSGAPMVIDLHGNTLTMQDQRNLSDFDDIASENGAIAVWPQGFDNSWNSGYCCSTAGELGLNDKLTK